MASTINGTSTGNGGLISTGDDSGILNIQTNETTAITVNASQNVGIGTTSPTTKLHITGNLTIENSSNAPFINFVESGDNTDVKARIEMDQVSGTAGNLLFYTEGSGTLAERMRIDSSGNLYLGITTTPGASAGMLFEKVGVINVSRGTTSSVNVAEWRNPNGVVGTIATSGSSTTYNTSSDYRLKENIYPMTGALAKVAQLKPVTYKWKVDGADGEGFIAHELAEVVPDCVTGEKDAVDAEGNPVYQGIDTSFLVATLTAALQETKALIDTQAETINALTARIVALEEK
jgi:hypothetical protein